MTSAKFRGVLPWFLLVFATLAVGFRLWTSFCFFPLPDWNVLRLAPSFMLRLGGTPYPGVDGGALTTWIYGPVPLLLNWPVTFADDSVTALLVAEGLNFFWIVMPVAVAIWGLAVPRNEPGHGARFWALLLCLALWPNSSLQHLQADNAALAFGLLSNVLLARIRPRISTALIPAALCAALAVWSKQTALGLVLAQGIWLLATSGPKTAARYAAVVAAIGFAFGGLFVIWFGFDGLWLNLVEIPSRLPLAPDLAGHLRVLWMPAVGYGLLPAIGLILFRRTVWTAHSYWLLPALSWLCLLPAGVVSFCRIGGATNSLGGFVYLLVPAALTLIAFLLRVNPRAASAWAAACVVGIVTQQLAAMPVVPVRPMIQHLRDAEFLAARFPRQIYFPWHPLVTFFSDRRFYHAEDGFTTRSAAGIEFAPEAVTRNLPPKWHLTATLGWREKGYFRQLQPPDAQLAAFGAWSLFSWPMRPATTPETNVPDGRSSTESRAKE